MNVLIACEFSGTVRDAFTALGHNAVSCDLLPTTSPGPHHQGDVLEIIGDGWDLMVAHPPCQYLSYAGARWAAQPGRAEKTREALAFFAQLKAAPIPRVCIENPRGIAWKETRPSQVIEPHQFGHFERKRTYLWLKNLPPLLATYPAEPSAIVKDWTVTTKPYRTRSITFPGIAAAMAAQWSSLPAIREAQP